MNRFRSWSPSLVLTLFAATLTSHPCVLTSAAQSPTAAVPEPFYLERTISTFGHDGTLFRVVKEVVARRQDGSTAHIQTIGAADSPFSTRNVEYADGTSVIFMDSIKAKSTFWRKSDSDMSRSQMTLSSDCGVAPPYKLLRHESVMGQETVVLQTDVNGRFRVTRWVAPRLGCEDLYVKSEARNPDGTFRVSAETKTDRLITGEPDAKWFDPGRDFQEMLPSEAQKRMIEKMNLKLTPDDAQRLTAQGERADKRYRGEVKQ